MAVGQCWPQLGRIHCHKRICETEETRCEAPWHNVTYTTERGKGSEGGGGVNEACLAGAAASRKQTKQLQGEGGKLATL